VARAVQLVWASPYSLLGLLLAPFFRSRRVVSGILVCEGASWPRKLGWRYRAITLGHVVLCVDEIDEHTLRHEFAHVRQYGRWGLLFPPVYFGASAVAIARGGHYYRDNGFEREARAIADLPDLPPAA
jgi:hypothetical protein